jgi:hypothetical protein
MNDRFELVKETSPQDFIVGVIHFHYVKRQILYPGVLDSAKGYWERNLATA